MAFVASTTPSVTSAGWGDPNVMFTLSQKLIQDAENYVAALESTQIVAPVINPNFPTIDISPAPVTAELPQMIDVTWSVPVEPPPFNGKVDVSGMIPGPFKGQEPTLNFGSPPDPFNGIVPPSPPIDLNFTYPNIDVSLPLVPPLLTLDVVPFNPVVIPSFDVTVPVLTLNPPNPIMYKEGPLYTSSLLTQLETDLQNALEEGTWTGLPAQAEQGMWDRAREREYRQMADGLADLERMEAMGFAFPPGVYIDARIKMQTEMQNTTAGLSREIMVKQAELTLTNINKARDAATTLEGKLIDYANQVAQRTFESLKYVTEAEIALYNGQVKAFEVSLHGFEVQAQVYDTKIKGLLAQVEVLKAQIAYEQTKAEINTAIVQQYKAEVDATQAIVDIYKLQVEIVQTRANIEKIKVDVFNAQIQAFVGQINAYTAEVQGYKAYVETQGVIESAYKTSVDAYAAEVNAGVAEVNATVAVFKGQIDAYTAQLDGYKAAITSMVGQAQAASLYNTAEADVYKAEVAAITSYNTVLTQQWEAVMNEQEKIAEVAISAAKANGDLFIAARGLSLDASKVGAQVSAQLGAAALGAIHWANSASWGYTNNLNTSAGGLDNTNHQIMSGGTDNTNKQIMSGGTNNYNSNQNFSQTFGNMTNTNTSTSTTTQTITETLTESISEQVASA